jgi:hypothetical protein
MTPTATHPECWVLAIDPATDNTRLIPVVGWQTVRTERGEHLAPVIPDGISAVTVDTVNRHELADGWIADRIVWDHYEIDPPDRRIGFA